MTREAFDVENGTNLSREIDLVLCLGRTGERRKIEKNPDLILVGGYVDGQAIFRDSDVSAETTGLYLRALG